MPIEPSLNERPTRPQDLVSGFGYRPALDGYRAVAVMLVVVYHLGIGLHFRQFGGWLGVDMFFVLSGYLITSLLCVERARSGRISLRAFYLRRMLRLAPLSLAVLAVIWSASTFAPHRSGLHVSNFGALSVIGYFSNWVLIHRPADLGSASHYWSLSIEEQFYLLWPLIVVVFARTIRNRSREILIGMLAIALVAQWYERRHLWRASFDQGKDAGRIAAEFTASTFQRPDGLLVGCVLGLVLSVWTPRGLWRRLIGCWALLGTVAIVAIASRADMTEQSITIGNFIPQWGLALFNVSGAGVIAWCTIAPSSFASRALARPLLVWIGRRAYGIFLIHPIVFGLLLAHTALGRVGICISTVVISVGLAAASFRWFEAPFLRTKARYTHGSAPADAPLPETPTPSGTEPATT